MTVRARRRPSKSETTGPLTLLAIGDSVIQGRSASRGQGWIRQCCDLLRGAGLDIRLIQKAAGGLTSDDLIAGSYLKDSLDSKPHLVILGLGVNDSRFRRSISGPEVPLDRFRSNIRTILASVRRTRATVVVSGQVPVIDSLTNPYKPDKYYARSYQLPYEQSLFVLAHRHKALFLDHFSRWLGSGESFISAHSADGLHPNDAGHTDLAKYAYSFLTLHASLSAPPRTDAHTSRNRKLPSV